MKKIIDSQSIYCLVAIASPYAYFGILCRISYFLILAFLLTSKQAFAVDDFQEEEVDIKEETRVLNKEGIQLARKKKYLQAIKKFRYLEDTEKRSAILYNNLGYTYQLSGNSAEAMKNYEKSVKRNANLIPPRANLGKLLFEAGECKKAITHGEYLLGLEPQHQGVKKWLPAAREKCKNNKENEINAPYDLLLKLGWQTLKISYSVQNILTIDDDFKYFLRPIGSRLPMTFNFDLRTYFQLKIKLDGLPFTGILNPIISPSEETLEFGYWFGKIYVSLGAMITQVNFANDSIPFTSDSVRTIKDINSASDFKFGLSFAYTSDIYGINVSIYPRYLFRDGSSGSRGIKVDRNFFSFDNIIRTKWDLGFWTPQITGGFVINEWYITEYQPTDVVAILGHYFGYYDFKIGTIFGESLERKKSFSFQIGFTLTARVYFLDINDTNPFSFGNGQGFFGLTTGSEIFRGQFIGGYRTYASKITFFSKQLVYKYFILEEAVTYTYVGTKLNLFNFDIKLSFHI